MKDFWLWARFWFYVPTVLAVFLLVACAPLKERPETEAAQVVFVACRVADVYTTVKIIGAGGKELNPLMTGFVHSVPQFVLVQAVVTGVMIWLESWINPDAALLVSAASCLAPIHNLRQIK